MNAPEAIEFAQELMIAYGLDGWRVELDRAVCRFGLCSASRKKITLSRKLVELNDQVTVLDTILHEIAHALAGAKAGHGPEWRRIAKSIGCSAQRCYSLAETVQPSGRLILRCPYCGQGTPRMRAPVRRLACASCCNRFAGGRFDARFLLHCELAVPLRRFLTDASAAGELSSIIPGARATLMDGARNTVVQSNQGDV